MNRYINTNINTNTLKNTGRKLFATVMCIIMVVKKKKKRLYVHSSFSLPLKIP